MRQDAALHESALPSALTSMREGSPAVRACGLPCSLLTGFDAAAASAASRRRQQTGFRQAMITGFTCQMLSAYSRIVRSEEKTPELAMLIADDLSHAA